MLVRKSTVERIEITEAPRLDPIRVYLEDYEPGKGRITISCYDAAWVGYWGGVGKSTIAEFFIGCHAEYLAGNLSSARGLKKNRSDQAYLIRVIEAVQHALKQAEASHGA